MKKFLSYFYLLVCLITTVFLTSCSPSKSPLGPSSGDTPPATWEESPIVGIWSGTMSDSSGPANVVVEFFDTGVIYNGVEYQKTGTLEATGPNFNGTVAGYWAVDISDTSIEFLIISEPSDFPPPYQTCSSVADGSATSTNNWTKITGTYSGTNSCSGSFTDGVMVLNKS